MGKIITDISVGDTNRQFVKSTNKQIELNKHTVKEISRRLGYVD